MECTIPYITNTNFTQIIIGSSYVVCYWDDTGIPKRVGYHQLDQDNHMCRIRFKPEYQHLESMITYRNDYTTHGKCCLCLRSKDNAAAVDGVQDNNVLILGINRNAMCQQCLMYFETTSWWEHEEFEDEDGNANADDDYYQLEPM
jgi:hypothetical protein